MHVCLVRTGGQLGRQHSSAQPQRTPALHEITVKIQTCDIFQCCTPRHWSSLVGGAGLRVDEASGCSLLRDRVMVHRGRARSSARVRAGCGIPAVWAGWYSVARWREAHCSHGKAHKYASFCSDVLCAVTAGMRVPPRRRVHAVGHVVARARNILLLEAGILLATWVRHSVGVRRCTQKDQNWGGPACTRGPSLCKDPARRRSRHAPTSQALLQALSPPAHLLGRRRVRRPHSCEFVKAPLCQAVW